ncbi:MAG: hypothetical protein ACFE7R_08660 [Candidatus Hodarchaeota archaeon]
MTQKKRLGFGGPFALGFGGAVVVFPILSFFLLLEERRLTWPNEGGSEFILYACVFVFLGMALIGLGLELIIEDSK